MTIGNHSSFSSFVSETIEIPNEELSSNSSNKEVENQKNTIERETDFLSDPTPFVILPY